MAQIYKIEKELFFKFPCLKKILADGDYIGELASWITKLTGIVPKEAGTAGFKVDSGTNIWFYFNRRLTCVSFSCNL